MNISLKEFLVKNELTNQEGNLLPSTNLPTFTQEIAGGLDEWEASIILGAIIKMANDLFPIDFRDLRFGLFYENEWDSWNVLVWHHYEDMDLKALEVVADTVRTLFPHMAGSNISYLASQITNDDKHIL